MALALGLIITGAAVLHGALALRSPSPWIIPDELIYSELAKSIGDGGLPRIRGEATVAYGLGYPIFIAPAWSVFDDVVTAYAAAKLMGALLLSTTALPAYFLAKRFVTDGYALAVAAFSVSVPSMLYAGTLLTEVALYPAFVLALLATTVAIEKPRARTQFGALAAIALASTIKVLAVVLLPALVVGVVLYHWLDTRSGSAFRARLRLYAPMWLLSGGGAAMLLAVTIFSGARARDALGAYGVVSSNVDVTGTVWWALLHVAELDLYVAVIPFVATCLILWCGFRADASRRERLFAASAAPIVAILLLAVGAYSSKPHAGAAGYTATETRIHERSTFILVPLFLVGLALWLESRRGRGALLAVTVVVAGLLPALIPVTEFDEELLRFQALSLVPWEKLSEDVTWPLAVLPFTFALIGVFALALRARASALSFLAPVALVFAFVLATAHESIRGAAAQARSVAAGSAVNWVDAAVRQGESVSVLWAEPPGKPFVELHPRQYVVFVTEFFNRSVGHIYELGSPMPYDLPTVGARLEAGRVVLEDGRPASLGAYVLAPCHIRVVAEPLAHDALTGVTVFRVYGPVRAAMAEPGSCAEEWRS